MAELAIDVFWSFRSPWSYLATPRLRAMAEEYELKLNFRPVYPIAIRTPDFFLSVNPQWPAYLMRDVHRVAEFLDIAFVWPNPDPVTQYRGDDGRARTAEDQPFIHRLTRLGVVATEQGKGIEFADAASSLIWGGTKDWHLGDLLAAAVEKEGLDLQQMDQIAVDECDRLESVIEKNQEDHHAVGHWGVPTCAFEDEPFFGQDRLDVLMWRLNQKGLKRRSE